MRKPHFTQMPRKFLTFNDVSDFVTYMLTAKTTCHSIAKKNSLGTDHKKSETTRYFSVLSPKNYYSIVLLACMYVISY